MALSIGFRIFSFLPSCYSSYGALDSYPGGTLTHCSCQPSLDAHFPFPIQSNEPQPLATNPLTESHTGPRSPGAYRPSLTNLTFHGQFTPGTMSPQLAL